MEKSGKKSHYNKYMRIVFIGTPDYVLPVLTSLYKRYNSVKNPDQGVVAVVTQPPKEVGRKKQIERSSVDNWAYKHKIPVYYDFSELPEADLGVLAAYGRIISSGDLNRFPLGILNIHPSLLPKYRGASPIQAAIANGETQTGVTVMKMDEKVDHGPIVSQFREEILSEETAESLRKRLFEKSSEFLLDLLPSFISQKIKLKEQNHNEATFTKLVTKQDGLIKDPFSEPSRTFNLYRAYQPWPGIWTEVRLSKNDTKAQRLKLLELHKEQEDIVLDKVQIEGKNPVNWKGFLAGYPDYSF